MTRQSSQFPRFYVTAPTPCPYLEDRMERKIFTDLTDINPGGLHKSLARVGFRRSQEIAYRPSCDNCTECKSVRVQVKNFKPTRTQRRIIRVNRDIVTTILPNAATQEHYDLLSKYLSKRHEDGGMLNMAYDEYVNMVESSPIDTCIIDFRLAPEGEKPGELLGVALTDIMDDSLSMVYSFFNVEEQYKKRSLGTYLILDHVARARLAEFDYVYLGYYVKNSPKMAYKMNFQPLEVLDADGWFLSKNS